MKKLLEKPWAKALAFLMTLLPGTAAVYGGVELVYIYVYNMHTDRRLDMLWAVTAVCAVTAAASLVFSLSAAGHWPGHEGIHLTWVEKIPVDLFVLGLTCVWYIYLDAVYYPSATLGLAVFVALAYLFVLAFTARCKAGTVLSDLLALRLLRLFSRGAVWTWRHLRRLFLGLPLAWKTAAVLLAVFALAAPGSRLFFPLVSLWCNLALFACVLLVLRVAGVKFDLFHKAIIVGLWAAALVYFFWALGRRSFVYIWDYFNYISKQYSAEAAFLQSPVAGFQYIFGSFAEDYTNFITLFLEFPFCLSNHTGDSFAFCQVFSILPMLLVLGLLIRQTNPVLAIVSGALFGVQSDYLVYQGELGVLKFLADILLDGFRVVPDKFDIKHGNAPFRVSRETVISF